MTPHEQSLIDAICPAIKSKKRIRFWYLNATSGVRDWRTVEPYLIGCPPRKHVQLSAWYIPTTEQGMVGHTESWRSYLLRNISDLQILEEPFASFRTDFDPKSYGMKEVICFATKDEQAFMQISR